MASNFRPATLNLLRPGPLSLNTRAMTTFSQLTMLMNGALLLRLLVARPVISLEGIYKYNFGPLLRLSLNVTALVDENGFTL